MAQESPKVSDTSRVMRRALWLFAIIGVMICFALALYFPAVPRSPLGWTAFVLVGIPVWLFLEWLGAAVLGFRFLSRLPSWGRVAIAVPLVGGFLIVAFAMAWSVRKLIVSL
jgi:hypothetical protein